MERPRDLPQRGAHLSRDVSNKNGDKEDGAPRYCLPLLVKTYELPF